MSEENMTENTDEELQESQENMDIDVEADEAGENSELLKKNEELTQQLDDAKDKYLRLCAEYDNYRKRTAKEKTEAYGNATAKCVGDILPVLDSFERAMEAECADESFKNGMQMIYNQFIETLKKIGVEEMDALGKDFDPNIHNAIKQTEDESFGENTVCEVFQKGYTLGDRVIRHAVVAVAN